MVDDEGRFAVSTLVLIGAVVVLGITTLEYRALCNSHYKDNRTKKFKGFIYNQNEGNAAKMKFGFYNSSYNGCSWIATYNATVILDKKVNPCDIIKEYEDNGAILGGTLGVKPAAIKNFFKDRGYKVTYTYEKTKFDNVAKNSAVNILYYLHKKGGHYIAIKWNGKNFIGYNVYTDSKKEVNFKKSLLTFLKNRKPVVLISINKK